MLIVKVYEILTIEFPNQLIITTASSFSISNVTCLEQSRGMFVVNESAADPGEKPCRAVYHRSLSSFVIRGGYLTCHVCPGKPTSDLGFSKHEPTIFLMS